LAIITGAVLVAIFGFILIYLLAKPKIVNNKEHNINRQLIVNNKEHKEPNINRQLRVVLPKITISGNMYTFTYNNVTTKYEYNYFDVLNICPYKLTDFPLDSSLSIPANNNGEEIIITYESYDPNIHFKDTSLPKEYGLFKNTFAGNIYNPFNKNWNDCYLNSALVILYVLINKNLGKMRYNKHMYKMFKYFSTGTDLKEAKIAHDYLYQYLVKESIIVKNKQEDMEMVLKKLYNMFFMKNLDDTTPLCNVRDKGSIPKLYDAYKQSTLSEFKEYIPHKDYEGNILVIIANNQKEYTELAICKRDIDETFDKILCIVTYSGTGDCGHYASYVRYDNNTWFNMDVSVQKENNSTIRLSNIKPYLKNTKIYAYVYNK
jgi:hypothetical protein